MQSIHNSVLPWPRIRTALSFFCVAALLLMSTGCSTLPLGAGAAATTGAATANAGQYQLKMESTFGGSKMYTGNIDGPVTIQTALERSGALKKYRDMEINVFRKIEGSYQPLKMTASFDARKRLVRPETDYGLRAGDSVLVQPKTQAPFSDVLGTLSR